MSRRPNVPHVVYRAFDAAGDLLYVGCTSNIKSRFAYHRHDKPEWLALSAKIDTEPYPDPVSAYAAEEQAILAERPRFNRVVGAHDLIEGDPRHGKAGTYYKRGCRCELCRAAAREHSRKYRRVDLAPERQAS